MVNYKKTAFVASIGLVIILAAVWMFRPATIETKSTSSNSAQVAVVSEADQALPQLTPWLESPTVDLAEGIVLAKERGNMMRELVRTNPEQAIDEALSLSEWLALPAEIKAYVEEPFSAVGDVEVITADGEDVSETSISCVFPNAERMETYVYGRRNAVGSKNGTPVQGIRIGNVGALREEIFQALDAADEAAALTLYPVAVADQGGNSVAALAGGKVFYFEDQAALDEANSRLAALEDMPGPGVGAQELFEEVEATVLEEGDVDLDAVEALAEAASHEWTGTARDMYVIMCDFSDIPGQPFDPVVFSNTLNGTVS